MGARERRLSGLLDVLRRLSDKHTSTTVRFPTRTLGTVRVFCWRLGDTNYFLRTSFTTVGCMKEHLTATAFTALLLSWRCEPCPTYTHADVVLLTIMAKSLPKLSWLCHHHWTIQSKCAQIVLLEKHLHDPLRIHTQWRRRMPDPPRCPQCSMNARGWGLFTVSAEGACEGEGVGNVVGRDLLLNQGHQGTLSHLREESS